MALAPAASIPTDPAHRLGPAEGHEASPPAPPHKLHPSLHRSPGNGPDSPAGS